MSGIVFYRLSIKDNIDVDCADEIIRLTKLKDPEVKINGLQLEIEEIYPSTFKTTFKDQLGDQYMVIHGYDVSMNMDSYWDSKRRDIVSNYLGASGYFQEGD
ncbi:hypothetical protein [Enterococcus sp. N249-2]